MARSQSISKEKATASRYLEASFVCSLLFTLKSCAPKTYYALEYDLQISTKCETDMMANFEYSVHFQEWTLISFLIAATVLKLVSVLHRTAHLILTKTFFIDWERPHVTTKTNTLPLSADVTQSTVTTAPVIWYLLLVYYTLLH